MKIYEPPAAVVDWGLFASDVKTEGRITRVKHIEETFGIRSRTTIMAIWRGQSIGLVPFLIVCKRLHLNPTRYLIVR